MDTSIGMPAGSATDDITRKIMAEIEDVILLIQKPRLPFRTAASAPAPKEEAGQTRLPDQT